MFFKLTKLAETCIWFSFFCRKLENILTKNIAGILVRPTREFTCMVFKLTKIAETCI
jgi:hypothetical protein